MAGCARSESVQKDPLAMIGFHEGTRRFAECAAGGTLVGVEVGFVEDAWSFGEAFIGSVRLICSSKKVSVEYLGDQDDTFVFGRLNLKTIRKVECEGAGGVAGFKWRAAAIKNPDGAEMRQAGLVVLCNRAGNAPLEMVLEHSPAASHTYPKSFTCKHVTQYAGLDSPKLTKMLMWFNRKSFAALEPLECA
ncbi:hypothetical protein CHLRE_01g070202v5 [Chlamydomonas reinhardtii]|uniref:Uncharacterized protein n=1 Tax=Chlamydomonas reinhardtii TaxID=3055 RepID=A0A2K3E8J0_CHLRE|nr:uncharacterized protein CHLRE_01g070202v5 [Chlamydomonas reinhardtii]PNW89094.1 hypothetical protein CHLRE_01g070202v5 [Chlamydomonas reinhardtii]